MLHEVWFQKDLNPCVNKTFPPDIALEQLEDTSLCFVHHAFGIFLSVILNGLALDYRAPHCSGLAVKAKAHHSVSVCGQTESSHQAKVSAEPRK